MFQGIDRYWLGHITEETIEQIAVLIEEILTGNSYTFVECNKALDLWPRVRTGQKLLPDTNGKAIHVTRCGNNFLLFVSDSYGIWGIHTVPKGSEDSVPYIRFEYNQFTVEHTAPAGHKLIWIVAVEPKDLEHGMVSLTEGKTPMQYTHSQSEDPKTPQNDGSIILKPRRLIM